MSRRTLKRTAVFAGSLAVAGTALLVAPVASNVPGTSGTPVDSAEAACRVVINWETGRGYHDCPRKPFVSGEF